MSLPEYFFNEAEGAYRFIEKEIPAQVFSCKFWEFFQNTFFAEHLWMTASRIINHQV